MMTPANSTSNNIATSANSTQKKVLVRVEDLSIGLKKNKGTVKKLTQGVSFQIFEQELYGLIGESGSGKTITAQALLGLFPPPQGVLLSGRVLFQSKDIFTLSQKELCAYRGEQCSMIFQEPSSAMNPLMSIEKQMLECYQLHQRAKKDTKAEIEHLLERVGLKEPKRVLKSYPHELSGGMLQRTMIAMALCLKPKLVIADEPTTALDVTVQAQIMELLMEVKKEFSVAILFITHNLNLIAQYADRLGVMLSGRLVEESTVDDFFKEPQHPYSTHLLQALPGKKPPVGSTAFPRLSSAATFAPQLRLPLFTHQDYSAWLEFARQHQLFSPVGED